MNTKCVIFDCDGTLVDSEYLCNQGISIMLEKFNVQRSPADIMQCYKGVELKKIISSLAFEHDLQISEDFIPDYRKVVTELFNSELKAIEGVNEVLKTLSLPICVATNGPKEKAKHALELTDLIGYFEDRIYSAFDIASWKPSPELFIHTARSMGFAPEQCLVVEDSIVGVEAANRAGIPVVQYSPEGAVSEGTHQFKHYREFTELLNSI